MKLHLGNGKEYLTGWTNIDHPNNPCKKDLAIDLEQYPWPFKNNTITSIYTVRFLEHLNADKTLAEIWRICKPKTIVTIIVPFSIIKLIKQEPYHLQRNGIGGLRRFIPNWIAKPLSHFFPVLVGHLTVKLEVQK